MQDRYTGDIGDYVKYGLLRALSRGRRLGVAWYLYPDEDHNADGRHITYLKDQKRWRHCDSALFDTLDNVVANDARSVSAIGSSGILGDASYHNEVLSLPGTAPAERRAWRTQWFSRLLTTLSDCEVVFADPDNGLCEDERFRPGRLKDWKRIPLREAKALSDGRTAVLYHHNTRRPGGHVEEIKYWMNKLGPGCLALRWRAYSGRTFFIVNPAPGTALVLAAFVERWGEKAEVHS